VNIFFLLQNVQTVSEAHSTSYSVDTGFVFSLGVGERSCWAAILTFHFHLTPRLTINGAIPLLPQYTFMVRTVAIYIAPIIKLFNEKI
jgi:hypothetical protein